MQLLPSYHWRPLLLLALLKVIGSLCVHPDYDLHRDEFLYIALGQHPAWGYWSNPPLLGWISSFLQLIPEFGAWTLRLFSGLLGGGLLLLTARIAQLLNGGKYAQMLAGCTILFLPAYFRTFLFYMPVPIEIVMWTGMACLVVGYLRLGDDRQLLWLGLLTGLAFLNKYSTAVFVASWLLAFLVTRQRVIFRNRRLYQAFGITLLVVLGNVLWQWQYNFPIFSHMDGLVRNQLVNVDRLGFLFDQLFMTFSAMVVWLPGLMALLFWRPLRPYRVVGLSFVILVALFLLLRGKGYYTLGAYPMLVAAGGVIGEDVLKAGWQRILVPLVIAGLTCPLLPLGLPIFSPSKQVQFHESVKELLGMDLGRRWEDGQEYSLPQDYADMLGWKELATITAEAYRQAKEPDKVLIYGENYGQAGAIDFYGREMGLPGAVSFADTYRIWAPEQINANTLIYINNELGEDVAEAFAEIRIIGSISHPMARERGTTVYLCQSPTVDVRAFWAERVQFFRSYWQD
jgi:hypothetical protein